MAHKEYPGKGKQKLTETIHAASNKTFGLQPARARLHYRLTTTAGDAVLQVEDMTQPRMVEQQVKAAVVGTDQMTSVEKMLGPLPPAVVRVQLAASSRLPAFL